MNRASLETSSQDAESISKALEIDNTRDEKIKVFTYEEGKKVVSEVKTTSLRSLLATLDDLIYCQMVAEKLIKQRENG